jgi:hypothetical protein
MPIKKPVSHLPNNDDLNVLNSPRIKNRGIDSKNLANVSRGNNKSITDFNNGNVPTKVKVIPPIPQQFTEKKNNDENAHRKTFDLENPSPKQTLKMSDLHKPSNIGSKSQSPTMSKNIPGISQPFQLLKYSAISRCGMVSRMYQHDSDDT